MLVAFRGTRSCGAMRFDMPRPGETRAVQKRIATTVIGMLCKIPGADAVVLVVYTDRGIARLDRLPNDSFVGVVLERARTSGFVVRDALCVGADAWSSYVEPAVGGHPLAEIAQSGVHAAVPERARQLAVLQSGAELPIVTKPAKEKCARLLRRYQRALDSEEAALELMTLYGDVLDPVSLVEEALGWNPDALEAQNAAALLFLTQGPAQRDQMMLQCAFGRDVGVVLGEANLRYLLLQRATGLSLDEIVRAEEEARRARRAATPADGSGSDSLDGSPDEALLDNAYAECGSDLILGLRSERPDPDRVQRAIGILKTAVALAPRAMRPAPLCMLAWLSWSLGMGSVAGMFLDQALTIDREYGMALLLNTLIGSGRLPEWAYAVPTS
ncbi:hypothetical protein GCM10022381_39330 [Leifsonia kafniensis]|uniref:DUF4192 domain-containing protein n=1 Tax=Leifsonia kafniensis TaxID=475957 RepID=A0ABP7L641_9MICO